MGATVSAHALDLPAGPAESATGQPTPLPAPPAARPEPARPRTKQAAAAASRLPQLPERWRSIAVGTPSNGALIGGIQLPDQGLGWVSYDAPLGQIPNRADRNWGTDRLIWAVTRILGDFHLAHPDLPPVLVGDLSRPRGGQFTGSEGGLGHKSHQMGLDADIYYPRRDRLLAAPQAPEDVDQVLAQELVDRFVAVGAQFVFTGPHLGLRGPQAIVQPLDHHDDHLHVRIP
jgi:murein endopeptidase